MPRVKNKAAALILLGIIAAMVSGCFSSPQVEKFYYTLGYDRSSEKPELTQREPIQARIWVRSAEVSRTYKRKQIVMRHFGPRISYLEEHLWANELEDKVPELIASRIQAYELFSSIQRDFPYSRPDFELLPTITAIEFIRNQSTSKASLHMRFDLRSLEGQSIVTTEIKREIPVYDSQLDSFVQVINEAILEYTDLFVQDVLAQFERSGPRRTEELAKIDGYERRDEASDEPVGQLLLPGLFEGREQPLYSIIEQGGEERVGRFGSPVELPVGNYTLRYGSGSSNKKIQRKVLIREGYRNIVEPDYGGLRVEILTPNGRPVELVYEVFGDLDGASYGTGYSSGNISEWDDKIWVLPAGRYKVTINNRPFASTRDYASAYVEKGEGNILTISVEKNEETESYGVVGGGVIKEPLYTEEDERWILSSSIAGNIAGTVNSRNNLSEHNTGYNFNGYLQNRLRYDYHRIDFSLLNLVELGALRSETGVFETTRDAVEIDSTLIYKLLLGIGLYGNFDISSHFLESYYRSDTAFDYQKLDEEGNLLEQEAAVESVQTAAPFMPVYLQEGLGINLSLVERPRLEADTRVGFGLRQNIYGGSFPVIDTSVNPVVLQRKEDEYSTGIEASLQLTSELLRNFLYTTRFDAYAPFTDPENIEMEWLHELQLALDRSFSIDYRATLYNTTDISGDFSINADQAVYLRFSTIYRLSF